MKRLPLIVVALGGLTSTPARAELDSPDESIRAVHRYAACVVYLDSSAGDVLGVPPGSQAERTLLRRIQTPRCITGGGFAYSLDFQPHLLRGAIAEEVLRLGDGNRSNGKRIRWAVPFARLTEADIAARYLRP